MTTAASMTYDSLVADIQTYAERDDEPFVTQIPRFVMMAENRIISEIKGLGFKKVVTTDLSVGTNVIAKPTGWRETISINVTGIDAQRYPLFERTYEYLRMYWPDDGATDVPKYYSDYDYEHYLIAPTPNNIALMEIHYYERPEPLSPTNQTSWTTQYAPQLLLYACLLEAQPFLKLDERIQIYQAMFDRASQSFQIEDKRRVADRSALVKEA